MFKVSFPFVTRPSYLKVVNVSFPIPLPEKEYPSVSPERGMDVIFIAFSPGRIS